MHLALVEVDLLKSQQSLEVLLAIGSGCLLVWLFFVGASVGSFLNVVAYRLPLGINLVRPGSRCPHCGHAIRIYDNLPVLGWFLLRGKCRDCRAPISFRYPLVETIVGLAFVALAVGEVLLIDWRNSNTIGGIRRALTTYELVPLWTQFSLHALLAATLFGAALMDHDGHRTSWKLFVPILLAGLIVPVIFPDVRRWPATGASLAGPLAGLLDGVLGLAAGALAGGVIGIMFRWFSPDRRWPPFAPSLLVASAGLVLGWQWAVFLATATMLYWWSVPVTSRIRNVRLYVPPAGILALIWLAGVLIVPMAPQLVQWVFSTPSLLVLAAALPQLAFLAAALAPADYFQRSPRNFTMAKQPARAAVNQDPRITTETAELTPQQASASYVLAFEDENMLKRPELRPVRMQLELLKPELILSEQNVDSTIVVFGGTRVLERHEAEQQLADARQALTQQPDDPSYQRAVLRAERILAKSHFYDDAREFGRIVSEACQHDGRCDYVVMTGGGPGVMEAANRGAADVGAKSVGLNITLPEEQAPNQYITPELCFQFHYFALRKMHFLLRAKALLIFPGGFGTLDELFEVLTLRQTNRMQEIPVILYCRDYWTKAIDFQFFADEGVIADAHLDLIQYAETPQQAWDVIANFHGHGGPPNA